MGGAAGHETNTHVYVNGTNCVFVEIGKVDGVVATVPGHGRHILSPSQGELDVHRMGNVQRYSVDLAHVRHDQEGI